MKKLKAHPAADAWPMLNEGDMAALADDIAAHGLQQPIVVVANGDGEKVILDGRNRYEACRLAKVTPTEVIYDGDDPVGFVLSSNEHRRHMTKGQRAMAIAKMFDFSEITQREAAEITRIAQGEIGKAATVLEYAPDLADAVIAGTKMLNDAYDKARLRKADTETDGAKLIELGARAPDLAEQVEAGKLKLSEALAAEAQREADNREAARRSAAGIKQALAGWHYVRSYVGGELQGIPVDEFLDDVDRKNLSAITKEMHK